MKHLSVRFISVVLILVSLLTYGLNSCNGKSSDQKKSTDSVQIMKLAVVSKGDKPLRIITNARYWVYYGLDKNDTIWALLWDSAVVKDASGKPVLDSITKQPKVNINWINVNPIAFSPRDSITVKPL